MVLQIPLVFVVGGVLRIDLDASLDAAARRVMHERLELDLPFLRQLGAVGGPKRDPRSPWALSLIYRALVWPEQIAPSSGKRIGAIAWRRVEEAMGDRRLAFDHAALIGQAVETTRREIGELELPIGFVPAEFTLGELQAYCEQLLGRKLDKSSFRRKLSDRGLVEAVKGAKRVAANRPAQIYGLRADVAQGS